MTKVREIMTTSPVACIPTNTLADVAGMMWNNDCGVIPVVADGGKVAGLITDRDICMAGLLNGRQLAHIAVEEVTSGKVFSCKPEDDVRVALDRMRENRVRRLPVVGDYGMLEGMLSMNDIILRAEDAKEKRGTEISYADVVKTYKKICAHPLPMQAKTVGA